MENALGLEHPDEATSLNNLALVYRDEGNYEYAESLFKQAIETLEKTLGLDHPDLVPPLQNYVGLLTNTGRTSEAERLEAQAKAIEAKQGQRPVSPNDCPVPRNQRH